MSTLLVRLEAPLQSWGGLRGEATRPSRLHPTKSGVVGLIANALGRNYTDPVDDLADLRIGVRLDRPGALIMDYQTVQNAATSGGGIKPTHVFTKTYLANACFLVGMEGEVEVLTAVLNALVQPKRLLFLGRKCCVPSATFDLPQGLVNDDLVTALQTYPWLGYGQKPAALPALVEDQNGSEWINDVPVGAVAHRRYRPRQVRWMQMPVTDIFEEVYEQFVFFQTDPEPSESY